MTRRGLARYSRQVIETKRRRNATGLIDPVMPARPTDINRIHEHDLAATWLGHATVLLRVGGVTVLTDPVFSDRIGVRVGPVTFGLDRQTPPPIEPEDLPPVDVVLISHAHFDHFDKPSLRRLASSSTTVVTARRTARLVPRGFGEVIELDWNEHKQVRGLDLRAIRPEHWGARAAIDRRRRFNAYVMESASHRVLFGGDTAFTDAFDHLSDIDLVVMGIGAYEPWNQHHANPDEVWTMFNRCGGRHLLPVHHSTFDLGETTPDEPMRRLLAAAGEDEGRIVGRQELELWSPDGRG